MHMQIIIHNMKDMFIEKITYEGFLFFDDGWSLKTSLSLGDDAL
jgi:hypothetical protein